MTRTRSICTFRAAKTSMGWLAVVASPRGVRAVIGPMDTRKQVAELLARQWPDVKRAPASKWLSKAVNQLTAFLAGERLFFDVHLDLSGLTPFRKRVLQACREIPYGTTMSYAELARKARSPKAARAVGGALGANPMPLLIPCHRVVRSDGALGGFSAPAGVALKQRLIALEAEHRSRPGRLILATGISV